MKKLAFVIALFCLLMTTQSFSHHILGRPAYSLNEDSNTPPSKQIELYVGDYTINYMVYPAFPKPHEAGRINFYASHSDSGKSYVGKVAFSVKEDGWFSKASNNLGTQEHEDNIFHQDFTFDKEGDYIITAEFHDGAVPYSINFPLRVGAPTGFGTMGTFLALAVFVLLVLTSLNQTRLQRMRTSRHYGEVERAKYNKSNFEKSENV